MRALVQEFWEEEEGLQTVELVLILIVMVGLVAALKNMAGGWLDGINQTVKGMIKGVEETPSPYPIN